MKVKFTFKKANRNIEKRLKELSQVTFSAGWYSDVKYDDGVSVTSVAYKNEFGSGKIPPRPFLRPAIKANKTQWYQDYKDILLDELNYKKPIGAGEAYLGADVAGAFQQSINNPSNNFKPLSKMTIAFRVAMNMPNSYPGAGEKYNTPNSVKWAVFNLYNRKNKKIVSMVDNYYNQTPLINTGFLAGSVAWEINGDREFLKND